MLKNRNFFYFLISACDRGSSNAVHTHRQFSAESLCVRVGVTTKWDELVLK